MPDYRVRSGDNLSSIARRNGTTVAQILAANPSIKDPNRINVNQSIRIPSKGEAPARLQRPQAPKPPAGSFIPQNSPVSSSYINSVRNSAGLNQPAQQRQRQAPAPAPAPAPTVQKPESNIPWASAISDLWNSFGLGAAHPAIAQTGQAGALQSQSRDKLARAISNSLPAVGGYGENLPILFENFGEAYRTGQMPEAVRQMSQLEYANRRGQEDMKLLSFGLPQQYNTFEVRDPNQVPESLRGQTVYTPAGNAEGRSIARAMSNPTAFIPDQIPAVDNRAMQAGFLGPMSSGPTMQATREQSINAVGSGRQLVTQNKLGVGGQYTYGETPDYSYYYDEYDYDTMPIVGKLLEAAGVVKPTHIYGRAPARNKIDTLPAGRERDVRNFEAIKQLFSQF